MLQHSDAVRHAHQLFERIGTRAEALAARRAQQEEDARRDDAARDWQRIRDILRERRGPRQT
jgi:hypothetical protein